MINIIVSLVNHVICESTYNNSRDNNKFKPTNVRPHFIKKKKKQMWDRIIFYVLCIICVLLSNILNKFVFNVKLMFEILIFWIINVFIFSYILVAVSMLYPYLKILTFNVLIFISVPVFCLCSCFRPSAA